MALCFRWAISVLDVANNNIRGLQGVNMMVVNDPAICADLKQHEQSLVRAVRGACMQEQLTIFRVSFFSLRTHLPFSWFRA